MVYRVITSQRVRRFLRKLDSSTSKRIVKKFKLLSHDPFRYLEHYEGDSLFKLRIGEYRALVDVDIENKTLMIQVLDKRSRVYKR